MSLFARRFSAVVVNRIVQFGLHAAVVSATATAITTLTPAGLVIGAVLLGAQKIGVVDGLSYAVSSSINDYMFTQNNQITA